MSTIAAVTAYAMVVVILLGVAMYFGRDDDY